MHIHIVTLFPEIFTSFLETSLIGKAQKKGLISFSFVNPRDFCDDPQQQVDDTLYGGGAGMLIKAKPVIDAIESIVSKLQVASHAYRQAGPKSQANFLILYPSPSKEIFIQKHAHVFAKYEHLIFVCGRYEGIDYRFEQYMLEKYPEQFYKLSLGQFVTLGGETPSIVMIEAITRLIPGVIKESGSWEEESYSIKHGGGNIEHPQYTKPAEVYGYTVPEVLVSGDQKKIRDWKQSNETKGYKI